MEKISWTDHVRNEEVLLRVNEQRNILHEITKWKANWIGHILRRNCLLKQVIEGKVRGEMEVTRGEEDDVRSYWMTLRTGEDILI